MKKTILLTLLAIAASVPAFAIERHQSYISFDEGGTVIRSGDGNEVDAQKNMPVYPEDEIVTARRGRAEIRLSDGNIVGVDRATALRFRSILDSYEGEGDETVAELRYGKVAIYRTDLGREHVRLDTSNASYVAEYEAIYSVETDSQGRDRVTVFDGSVEVRTPSRTSRVREGESANVDDRGLYDTVSGQSYAADEFERWFLARAERFDERSSRYVDRDLSYWTDDLDSYGSWVTVGGIGHAWRPAVSVGWRPYYNGYWHRSRWGTLTWVSYDPWGWGPYHYGRWSYDPFYGWVWVPGLGYAPAWVYWWYGPSYVGWAPSGFWDCYRPYYGWAYQPYRSAGFNVGFGFWGRVNVNEMDLRPWTFVDSVGLISTRVDRAALTTDAIKQRLGRSGARATIAGGAARFTNEDMRDPAEAIRRRSIDGFGGRSVTGRETGAPPTDLTPFFRRDGQVSGTVRDRIVRSRGGSGGTTTASGGNSVAPIGSGSVAPIGRGSVAPITGGGTSVDRRGGESSGRIERGSGSRGGGTSAGGSAPGGTTSGGTIDRGTPAAVTPPSSGEAGSVRRRGVSSSGGAWRGSTGGSTGSSGSSTSGSSAGSNRSNLDAERVTGRSRVILPDNPSTPAETPRDFSTRNNWRSRTRSADVPAPSAGSSGSSDRSSVGTTSDVPRRVIDRIGGARIVPRDTGSTGDSSGSYRDRSSSGSRSTGSSVRGSSGSSSRGSYGGGSSSGSSARSGGSSSSGSSASSGSRSSGSSNSGGGRSSSGNIRREH